MNTLNFIYLAKAGHQKAVYISHGRILEQTESNSGMSEGDNTIDNWHDSIAVDGVTKRASVQSNMNNAKVMAYLVQIGIFKCKDDGYTPKALADDLALLAPKKVATIVVSKLAKAIETYGDDLSDWPTPTLKSVARELEIDDSQEKAVLIEKINEAK